MALLGISLTACQNQDVDFPDFDYSTVYFSYQYPARTLMLGDDIYDNSLDNAHKCKIMATMGGVYHNNENIRIGVKVDNTLCDNLVFTTTDGVAGGSVMAMPASYYQLPDNMNIVIPKGKFIGGIEVQLTDAFFADPNAIKNTYVIPLRMVDVEKADSILRGKSTLPHPNSCIPEDWEVLPKDYILYCVKYINPWHGTYLRRGIDQVKGNNGNTSLDDEVVYHKEYVEKDELCNAVTQSMNEVTLSLHAKDKAQVNIPFQIVVKFNNEGNAVVSAPENVTYSILGTGKFVKNGDAWGNKPRNVMHLKYSVDFGEATHSFTDTLVVRDRGVGMELFTAKVGNN